MDLHPQLGPASLDFLLIIYEESFYFALFCYPICCPSQYCPRRFVIFTNITLKHLFLFQKQLSFALRVFLLGLCLLRIRSIGVSFDSILDFPYFCSWPRPLPYLLVQPIKKWSIWLLYGNDQQLCMLLGKLYFYFFIYWN